VFDAKLKIFIGSLGVNSRYSSSDTQWQYHAAHILWISVLMTAKLAR